jgi:hypothetical protein
MQELLDKLRNIHGLSTEQSHGILNTIKDYVKEKFPMVAGAIDNIFPAQPAVGTTPAGDTGTTAAPESKGGSFLDNISNYIPGSSGEKMEEFAKDKLGGLFGGEKHTG